MGGAAAARAMAAVSRLTEDAGASGTPPPTPSPCIQPEPNRNRAAAAGSSAPHGEGMDVHPCESEDYEALLLGLDAMLNTGSQDMAGSGDLLTERPPEPSNGASQESH